MSKEHKEYEIVDDEYGRLIVRLKRSPFKNFVIAFGRIQLGNLLEETIADDTKLDIRYQYNILSVPQEHQWANIKYPKLEKRLGSILDHFMKNHFDKIPIGNPFAELEDENTEIIEIGEVE